MGELDTPKEGAAPVRWGWRYGVEFKAVFVSIWAHLRTWCGCKGGANPEIWWWCSEIRGYQRG